MKTGHGKYVYVEEQLGMHRWECSACGLNGHWVRSATYAEEMGDRHADKFTPKSRSEKGRS